MNRFEVVRHLARYLSAALIGAAALHAHAAAPAVQDRTVNAAGLQIHTLQAGSGSETPVVLLHGYAETSRMWLPLIPRLAESRVVLAPDLPGAGTSSIPASGFDKKTLAQNIHAMVHALGYRKVKVVGHDIGLMVAYAYAAQYPDEVESVTLMDAFLPGVGDWQKVWLLRDLWHFHFYGETPLKLVQGRERIYFEHFWNDFAADRTRSVPEADRRFYAATYARPGRMAAGFEYFHTFAQDAEDFAAFARTPLPMPVLVLAGEKASGTFLIDQARLVAGNVTGVSMKGSGHWLMEEAPEQTISEVVRFINAPAQTAN
ncbi:alpha/beta fold hydrolase [Cupriavidus lacunae]|uniref:Alpha/beta hydrolase n=1 Tax=Cupriavidus lacunae TaxID=2666307 RepID=A0A370NHC7_9BURK|nr:alpha/beta hydrolase [Cupriavidus lacunae]RDK05027.1 alpha/beta hydrolase [Cupriavidus lacunae]